MTGKPTQDDIDSAFRAGDAASVIGLLDAGLDPAWKDAQGDTLTHRAARLGHVGLIEELVARGAPAFAVNDNAETPQELAIIWGHDTAAAFLKVKAAEEKLTHGAGALPFQSLQEIRDRSLETGVNQLHDIVRRGQFSQVLTLAANDAQGLGAPDLLAKGLDGDTVLLQICQQGQLPQLMKPELWMKKPQDAQAVWDKVPAHYKKQVDYDTFITALRQMKLQSYGKLKIKGFQK